jgi:hypothetical protein
MNIAVTEVTFKGKNRIRYNNSYSSFNFNYIESILHMWLEYDISYDVNYNIKNKMPWYQAIGDDKENIKNTNKESLEVDLLQRNERSNTFMASKLGVKKQQ